MSQDAEAAATVASSDDKSSRLAELIIFCDRAKRRIAELEDKVAELEQALSETRTIDSHPKRTLRRHMSAPLLDQPFKKDGLQQISEWNKELVTTVEEMRGAMLKMETDAKVQLIVLGDEVERLRAESEALRCENDALKERVADDVLRQRQTNRVEMAFEKAKIASRVRAAGLRRLECMEAVLMETHDDLYYVQRFDAAELPVRDVTFVMHIVSNVTCPHVGGEEFTMNIYQKLLRSTARQYRGYHVCSVDQLEVFAFHSGTAALYFSKECHLGVTNLAWPSRTSEIPYFAPVIDNGEVLYSGPRMHTCMYTCNPGTEVDPINGRPVYYGQEVRDAVTAALNGAPIGEIVANEAWAKLFCKEMNIMNDVHAEVCADVQHVRSKLGAGWSVVTVDPSVRDLLCSILPVALERRRGLPPYYLQPVPRFARSIISPEKLVPRVLNPMKGVTRLCTGSVQPQQQLQLQQQKQKQKQHEGWVDGLKDPEEHATEERDANCADLLALYSLRRERTNIISLYKKLEAVSAFQEQSAMEAEDWYLSRFQSINPDEASYVCTVDVGDDASWRQITQATLNAEEHDHLRDLLLCTILSSGKKNNGVHVNGNNKDVFTFAFRQPEHALCFAAQVYTTVSEKCASLTTMSEMCLMRGGLTKGHLVRMIGGSASAAAFNSGGGVLCRGKALALSGSLCDVARYGEILASADVVQAYYATKVNLASMAYNVLRCGGRIFGRQSSLVDLCSIIPKPYAYRRQWQMSVDGKIAEKQWECPARSAMAALQLEEDVLRREEAVQMLQQQQQLIERAEAATMAMHDTAWDHTAHMALRLPWPVSGASIGMHNKPELGFMFCDVNDAAGISCMVPDDLYKEIMALYNYVVQKAVLAYDGFIAKTDSVTAYIVIFPDPHRAMETALQIQRSLLEVEWPTRLLTIEATLHVQSAKTGTLLFHGVRAKTVVHASQDYHSTRSARGEYGEAGDVSGAALDAVATLGLLARGGEILVTPDALHRVSATLSGSLLLQQVAIQAESLCAPDDAALASCVPRKLWERLNLFIPAVRGASSAPSTAAAKESHARSEKRAVWWHDTNNAMAPLPLSRMPLCIMPRNPPLSTASSVFLQPIEDAVSCIKRDMAEAVDTNPCRESFLIVLRDALMGVVTGFRILDDGITKAAAAAATAAALSTENSTGGAAALMSTLRRTPADMHKKSSRVATPVAPGSGAGDPYRTALQFLDTLLRGLLQRSSRTLGGAHQLPSALNVRTPPRVSTTRGAARVGKGAR
ncbi:hypothetical protein DQ04_04121060 [Trypanosoma grayi]|uniref:hypothetical protein n=1 Tax=Trypanosoma grayi TaxID=71804 RepID=UPI0004F42245|nr:hypothetical protein DQ04_04121060 [Trypanosoma grayi]KEG10148.1 hypothetical protein DQ04_04121060 [Trypanosoma grayi]